MAELTRYQMYINGEWVDAENGATFTSVNPATGQTWAEVPEASEADIDRAVEAAHRAFSEGAWATMTPTARGKMLRRLAEILAEHSEPLGRCETVDTGKLFKETRWQANYISDFFQYYAGLADKVSGETLPIDKPDMMAMTIREPLGVVAAVVPWNSQLFLVAVKIGPALAAGNTVVLKASEHASAPMLEFAKVFEEAGFPPGVFNVVTGHGEPCGRALTSHPLVDRVSFTGGPETAGDHRRLLETIGDYCRLLETIGDYWRLLETTGDHWRLVETIGDCWGPLETAGDHWRLLETTGDHWRLLETIGDCWRLLETVGDCWRPLETAGDHWRVLETTGDV